jgi:hypothetical protein
VHNGRYTFKSWQLWNSKFGILRKLEPQKELKTEGSTTFRYGLEASASRLTCHNDASLPTECAQCWYGATGSWLPCYYDYNPRQTYTDANLTALLPGENWRRYNPTDMASGQPRSSCQLWEYAQHPNGDDTYKGLDDAKNLYGQFCCTGGQSQTLIFMAQIGRYIIKSWQLWNAKFGITRMLEPQNKLRTDGNTTYRYAHDAYASGLPCHNDTSLRTNCDYCWYGASASLLPCLNDYHQHQINTGCSEMALDGTGGTGSALGWRSMAEVRQEVSEAAGVTPTNLLYQDLRRIAFTDCEGHGDEKMRKKAQRKAEREDKRTAKRIRKQSVHEERCSQLGIIDLSDDEPYLVIPDDNYPRPRDDYEDPYDFEEGSMWTGDAHPDKGGRKRKFELELDLALRASQPSAKRTRSPPAHRHENMARCGGASGSGTGGHTGTVDDEITLRCEPAAWPQVSRKQGGANDCVRDQLGSVAAGSRGSRGPLVLGALLGGGVPEALVVPK